MRLAHTANGAFSQIFSARTHRLVERLARIDQPADQAEIERPLGGDRLAGEDHLHRRRLTDRPRQAEQAAGTGDQVALDLGEPERGLRRRDDQVAGEDDLTAAGGGEPVDGDDHRFGALAVDEAGEAAAWRC